MTAEWWKILLFAWAHISAVQVTHPIFTIFTLHALCSVLNFTNLSGAVKTREDNTVYPVYVSHICFIIKWVTEKRSFGNIISAGNTFRYSGHALYTPDNTYKPCIVPLPPPVLFFLSLPQVFLPVSGIMHVFTSKVIVPDLYDRSLTLRVLVHQHQAENTQGHVWAGPNLALCHSMGVTSN